MTWWRRYRYGFLLVMLVVVILSPVLQESGIESKAVAAILLTALTLAAINAVSAERRMRRIMIVLAVIAFFGGVSDLFRPSAFLSHLQDGSAVLFFGLVAALILRDVLAPGRITVERITAAICVYFTFAMLWSAIYSIINTVDPHAFRGIEGDIDFHTATYFSLVTLTTLGYGDVAPLNPVARSFAVLQAATGVLYVATLVARLVALQIAHSSTQIPDEKDL